MRKITTSLLILSVFSLSVAVLAASANCPLMGNSSGMDEGCCCGEAAACDLPASGPSLPASGASVAGTCCEVTQNGHSAEEAAPATLAVTVSDHHVPSVQIDYDTPRTVTPTSRSTFQDFDTGRPPPYRLFCSLLI